MEKLSLKSASLPKRRWMRFSLRSLLLFVLPTSCLLAWVPAERRRLDEWRSSLERANFLIASSVSAPKWRTRLFGDPLPEYATSVSFLGHEFNLSVLASLEKLPRLEMLSISNAHITDEAASQIARLPRLKSLWIAQCEVTEPVLRRLGSLNQLELLDISGTYVNDEGMEQISRLASLRTLRLTNLSHVLLSTAGVRQLEHLKQLTELILPAQSLSHAELQQIQTEMPGCKISQ